MVCCVFCCYMDMSVYDPYLKEVNYALFSLCDMHMIDLPQEE
uniref:Uncharacterized protein n=1 Tax=Arundo donax TaxID=35708 RepID=A0A0A9C884_ARUDO